MKHHLLLFVSVLMVAACGGGSSESASTSASTATSTPPSGSASSPTPSTPVTGTSTTVVTPQTDIKVHQTNSDLALVPEAVTLQQLVDGLNALGISPRDLIAILQAIKATGALQAEIEVI